MGYRPKNIPDVSEYSHWNEEAEQVWYAENKYDMEHPYEWVEDYEGPEGDEDGND